MRCVFSIFTICLVIGAEALFAQDYQADPLSMAGQAAIVSFRYEVGESSAKLFVVGYEAAKLNFDTDLELLEVTAFKDDVVKERLQFSPDQGFYIIRNPPGWKAPYQLKVRARVGAEERELNLNVKP